MATVKVTEQKVILCGEYGVGKTSIFRRFANNTFVASSDRKSTLGLDNIDKEYVVDDRRIRVSSNSRTWVDGSAASFYVHEQPRDPSPYLPLF